MLQEAEALRHKIPTTFIPPFAYGGSAWGQGVGHLPFIVPYQFGKYLLILENIISFIIL